MKGRSKPRKGELRSYVCGGEGRGKWKGERGTGEALQRSIGGPSCCHPLLFPGVCAVRQRHEKHPVSPSLLVKKVN